MSIRYKKQKKNHAAWQSLVFPFDVKLIFFTEDTDK